MVFVIFKQSLLVVFLSTKKTLLNLQRFPFLVLIYKIDQYEHNEG